VSDYNPGGFVPDGPIKARFTHPWKYEPILPLRPTPEQLEQAATIKAFQDEIDLIDTSWMDEQ
jgi:hypothetical protein